MMKGKSSKINGITAKKLIVGGAILLLILIVAGVGAWSYFMGAAYSGDKPLWVYIPAGIDKAGVDSILKADLGDAGERAAFMWDKANGTTEKAHGAYLIEPGDRAVDIAKRLKRGGQTPVRFTFNNIRTLGQLAARADEKLELDSLAFVAACDSLLPGSGFNRNTYVAAFLPDSYEFYWTSSPEYVVKTLLEHRNRFWNDERRAAAGKMGLTPVQVATLASIAEEETNSRDERPVVARLYLNRFNKGMKLQADPTVKFALGDFSIRRITGRHLETSSPYNTYRFEGLPPGPIRIPEAATLQAVLDSKPNDYLYMCAKEDFSGKHNFTKDYSVHQQNARRYRDELNRRNIK